MHSIEQLSYNISRVGASCKCYNVPQHPILQQSMYSVYATKQHALYLQILYNIPAHKCKLSTEIKKSIKGYKSIMK